MLVATEPARFSSAEQGSLLDSGHRLIRIVDFETLAAAVGHEQPDLVILDEHIPPSDQLRWSAQLKDFTGSSRPLMLCVTPTSASGPPSLRSPWETVSGPMTRDAILRVADWALSCGGRLQVVLNSTNSAVVLAEDNRCQWIKTRIAIAGLVKVEDLEDAKTIAAAAQAEFKHAYSLLDRLPDDRLSFDDLWNLVLFVALPLSDSELQARRDVSVMARRWVRDTGGSRKIVLLKPMSPQSYIGSFNIGSGAWSPIVGNPLREAVRAAATSDDELAALEVLFKRKIYEPDLDQLIHVLGRQSNAD